MRYQLLIEVAESDYIASEAAGFDTYLHTSGSRLGAFQAPEELGSLLLHLLMISLDTHVPGLKAQAARERLAKEAK